MSITNLVQKRVHGFGDKEDGGETWLQFDATVSEGHSHKSRVTTNPVQNGANVATNIINDPSQVTLVGVVTDTPFFTQRGNGFDGTVKGITGLFEGNSAGERSQLALQELVKLKNNRGLLTIDTGLVRYRNMVLVGVDTTTTKNNYHAPEFTLQFTEVILAPSSDGGGGKRELTTPKRENDVGLALALGGILLGSVI